jgi:pyrophosphatase PpaX
MTPPPLQAAIFDVDGTLIDSYRLYIEAYRRALEPYVGRLPSDEEIATASPTSERHFLVQWLGEEEGGACHAAMCRAYEELHTSLCEGPYDGVREMLAALRAAGVRLAIVTGKGRHAWEVTQRELDLGDFEAVVTEDDVALPKPDPGGILAVIEALRLPPERAVYVGDSVGDVAAGRAAGLRVGAALWPKVEPDDREEFLRRIAEHQPDWLFERPADVTRALAPWC